MSKQIGALIAKADDARNVIRQLDEKIKVHKQEYDDICRQLIELMEKEGVNKTSVGNMTASITLKTVANVIDWEKFHRYIKQHSAFHLLHRRVSDAAFREEVEERKGKLLPGTEKFVKKTLSLRVT